MSIDVDPEYYVMFRGLKVIDTKEVFVFDRFFPVLIMQDELGNNYSVYVSCDPEHNGPGFLSIVEGGPADAD